MTKKLNVSIRFLAAVVTYAGFSVYLFWPYLDGFGRADHLFPVSCCLAAVGCFLLSRRWVICFAGSFFAGAVYGFGPFFLGLGRFHPAASLLAAMVPWLFLPAAFGPDGKWRWVRIPLSIIPFLAIIFFFQVSAHFRLFAVPIDAKLHLADLAGLIAPLAMVKKGMVSAGFYHVPVAPIVVGFLMLLAARRYAVMVILGAGIASAFCGCLFNVSGVMWLSVCFVCFSIIMAMGVEGLTEAGSADGKWILLTVILLLVLTVITLFLAVRSQQIFAGLGAGYSRLFVRSAVMYILGAVTAGIIFFMVRAKIRLRWLRLILLSAAMGVDIFLGAILITDYVL